MEKHFEIKEDHGDIIIGKDGKRFSVEKYPDGDIWFCTANPSLSVPIDYHSRREPEEDETYRVFEGLMKSIIGRYYLYNDTGLPEDFINIENQSITWHSDTDPDNTLKLQLSDHSIYVMLYQEVLNAVLKEKIKVRIRTSGSQYGYYYQEFEKFYHELSLLASRYTEKEVPVQKKKRFMDKVIPKVEKK